MNSCGHLTKTSLTVLVRVMEAWREDTVTMLVGIYNITSGAECRGVGLLLLCRHCHYSTSVTTADTQLSS